MKKVAVILAGCGTMDGSEINETVTLLLALDQHNIEYQAFAPDAYQAEVCNHTTGKRETEKRNMMVEAARIVRGKILPLSKFNADDFDALLFPGGNGAAKNIFTYAYAPLERRRNEAVQMESLLGGFCHPRVVCLLDVLLLLLGDGHRL